MHVAWAKKSTGYSMVVDARSHPHGRGLIELPTPSPVHRLHVQLYAEVVAIKGPSKARAIPLGKAEYEVYGGRTRFEVEIYN